MSCRLPGLYNLSGLDQFKKFFSLAHFPVSEKKRTAHSFPLLPTYKPGTYRAVAPARFGKVSHGSLVSLLFLPTPAISIHAGTNESNLRIGHIYNIFNMKNLLNFQYTDSKFVLN